MTNSEANRESKIRSEDDEPDEWDKRIFSTGCAAENMNVTDCFYEKKDWRACKEELELFKKCWKRNQNEERTNMEKLS